MPRITEVAHDLGLSSQTIYHQLSAGTFTIKIKHLGRLLKWGRRDVDRFLDRLPCLN